MGRIYHFFDRFVTGDPVARLSARNMNRIANVLEGITGIGCRVVKPTDAEGLNWKIVVDGSSDGGKDDGPPTDFEFPSGGGGLPSGGSQYQVLQKASDTEGDVEWGWLTFKVPS